VGVRRRRDLDDPLVAGVPDVAPADPHLDRVVAGQHDQVGGLQEGEDLAVGDRRQPGAA
jgi:hypothetical protein